ncbi:helix-turn-helix domain-containing protein [Croceicoccus sp. YJ47]|nr:helix-turn-helix domain-containing protein [Croceicoccus sp. YJ47]
MESEPFDLIPPHAAFAKAVEIAGGQTAMARICECSQGNIWQHLNRRSLLPAHFVLKVEAATGVSRHDLRPDIYPRDPASSAVATPAPCAAEGDALISSRQSVATPLGTPVP